MVCGTKWYLYWHEVRYQNGFKCVSGALRSRKLRTNGSDRDPEHEALLWPKHPTLIINAASSQSLHGRSRRPIANISFLTHRFWTVEAYADCLLEKGSERAITHRLTHDTTSQFRERAIQFGDCHADRDGIVDVPPEGHDHHGTDSSCGCGYQLLPHHDTASDHVKCLSLPGYWHGYSGAPAFELTNVGDRGIKYIRGYDGLDTHLNEYGLL